MFLRASYLLLELIASWNSNYCSLSVLGSYPAVLSWIWLQSLMLPWLSALSNPLLSPTSSIASLIFILKEGSEVTCLCLVLDMDPVHPRLLYCTWRFILAESTISLFSELQLTQPNPFIHYIHYYGCSPFSLDVEFLQSRKEEERNCNIDV